MADSREALRKLQSGQALTQEEKVALNLAPAATPTPATSNMERARAGEQASIDKLANFTPTEITPEQDSALKDAALGIDRAAGTITDDRTGNTVKLDSKLGQTYLKQNTQNFEDVNTPQPYDAPEGTHWDWDPYNRKWTLYKDFTNEPAGGGGGGGGNGTGQVYTASDGKTFTDQQAYVAYEANLKNAAYVKSQETAARQSAYDLLYNEFNKYGLGTLVESIKGLIQENISPSEFTIRLQNTDAYKKRFAANQDRLAKGLRALSPAEYINMEDQYQEIMRRYGLPASYYSKGDMGIQEGFNKLISNDVSATELEDRVMTAQNRLINTDVNTLNALRQFYPNITNGDLLAYTLDPTNAIGDIKRKATAAEIGGAALAQGLGTDVSRAEELAKYGVDKAQAQQGYQTIGEFLPTATQLGDIYAKQGLGSYNQGTAETEIFGTAGASDAARKRKKLAELERASFSGTSGQAQGALARDRAGSI